MADLPKGLSEAIRQFWATRQRQQRKQKDRGRADQGSRGAVTGGGQLDGFTRLVSKLLVETGVPEHSIFRRRRIELPGYYRPTKEWDLLVVFEGKLLASIEFKSQVGPSFGNNYNNRTEEALGSATDIWAAYREGVFEPSPQPWLGYFMLLEEAPRSTSPVRVEEPHFKVFKEFRGASYAKRYEMFCQKLVRERLYSASCLILSNRETGPKGEFREPSEELSFEGFAAALIGHVTGYFQSRKQ
jgi:hypothetical protein